MQKKIVLTLLVLTSSTFSVQPYFYKVNPFRAGILPDASYQTRYIAEINASLGRKGSVMFNAASLANPGALAVLRKAELFAHIQQTQKKEPGLAHKLLNNNVKARLGSFAHVTFPLVAQDAPLLIGRIRQYATTFGFPMPMVYFVNAASFANIVPISFGHDSSAIIIGRGLLERVPEAEINRIILKELSHIYHRHDVKKIAAQVALMAVLFGFDFLVGNKLRAKLSEDIFGFKRHSIGAELASTALRLPLMTAYKGAMDLSSSLWSDHFTSQAMKTASQYAPTSKKAAEKQARYLEKITKHDHSLVQGMVKKRFKELGGNQVPGLLNESNDLVKKRSFGLEGAGWFDTHLPLHEQADQLEDELEAAHAG